MSMVDNYGPSGPFSHPHRKPVPIRSDIRHLSQLDPVQGYTTQHSPSATTTTTTSFSAYPPRTTSTTQAHSNPLSSSPAAQTYNNAMFTSRRTPSQSTTSTTGFTTQTTTTFTPSRTPSNVSSKISRTSSTRSVGSPTSYVALLRKQKATVWCDRAQPDDPRLSAQHKAAKMRATRELTGMAKGTIAGDARSTGSGSMGSSSLGVRSKIRHHGVPKAHGILGRGGNLAGGGVPTRLSSNEAGDDGVYMGGPPAVPGKGPHQRSSSFQSRDSRFLSVDTSGMGAAGSGSMGARRLSGGSERTGSGFENADRIDEMDETPEEKKKDGYFDGGGGGGGGKSAGGSGSERENSFGIVGGLPQAAATVGSRERAGSYGKVGNSADDLKRRGSVDERGLFPHGTGRLVIVNPDADSD